MDIDKTINFNDILCNGKIRCYFKFLNNKNIGLFKDKGLCTFILFLFIGIMFT